MLKLLAGGYVSSNDLYMNIVINAFSARRGGGQTYLINLLQYLDDCTDASVFILAPDSLKLPETPAIRRLSVNWPNENPLVRTVWEKFVLPKMLLTLGADVLFTPGGLLNTHPPLGCKTVTMFRNMIPFDIEVRKKYPLGLMRVRNWLLERSMLSSMMKADLVIFISEFARGVIESRVGKENLESVTIPHGLSDHFKLPAGEDVPRPGWLPDGEYLLYVSLFEVYKKHLEVVRGYHHLKQMRCTTEKLILAGLNAMPFGDIVREEIKKLGLEDDVILSGNIAYDELPAVYKHAKVNVFASECENCPNILLEALGAGRPLLVSECEPMPEFGGDAVVYFDPRSPVDFAEKLSGFIDNPVAIKTLAEKAAKQSELFDWEQTAAQTWAALQSLCRDEEV